MADDDIMLPSDRTSAVSKQSSDDELFTLPSDKTPTPHIVEASSGALGKTMEPITSYPGAYAQMNRESREQMAHGVEQLTTPTGGDLWESAKATAKGLGNLGAGAAGYVASPIAAGLRTIVGNPIEQTTGIPKEYSEFAAGLALPGIGLRGVRAPPSTPATGAQVVAEAAKRLSVPISRAAASESVPVQSTAGALKEIPVVGTPLVKSAKQSLEAMDRAVGETVSGYGSGQPLIAGQKATEGIENWITGKSADVASRLYGQVDRLVDPNYSRGLDATSTAVSNIMARRANARISGASPAVGEVTDAITTPMNYEGLKNLRTYIGEMTPEEMVAKGIGKQEAKQIYNALTQDLRKVITEGGGPDALAAFNKANKVYEQIAAKRADLSKVLGVKSDAAPELVMQRLLSMAGSKSGADYQRLVQVRRAIGPEKWDEVTSSVVNQMGRDKPGADFSGARFKTSWDALPNQSKRLLFNSTGKPELAKSVEDLMTLGAAHKRLTAYGNPSGTGRVGSLLGAAGVLWASPLTAIEMAVGGNMLARFLASPVSVKQANKWAMTYNNAMKNPTPARMTLLTSQSNNLAGIINKELGGNVAGQQFLPKPRSEDQQQPSIQPISY